MVDTELEPVDETSGYPWDPEDPRTPSLVSYPGGPPLSFDNAEKLRRAEEDQRAFIEWYLHATDEERAHAETVFKIPWYSS